MSEVLILVVAVAASMAAAGVLVWALTGTGVGRFFDRLMGRYFDSVLAKQKRADARRDGRP